MLISVYFPLNIAIAWIQHLVGWNPVQLLECHIPMRELWELVLNWNPYGLISGPYGAWERQILGNNYDHPSMGHGMEVRLGCQYIKWCVHFYWYHLSIACPQANRLGCCMNHLGQAKRLNYSWRTTTHQQDQWSQRGFQDLSHVQGIAKGWMRRRGNNMQAVIRPIIHLSYNPRSETSRGHPRSIAVMQSTWS